MAFAKSILETRPSLMSMSPIILKHLPFGHKNAKTLIAFFYMRNREQLGVDQLRSYFIH